MTAVMERPATLSWRRPVKDRLQTGTKRTSWLSGCGRYRVEEHKEPRGGVLYLAFARDVAGTQAYMRQIGLRLHRTQAVRLCEEHRDQEDL